MSDLRLRQQRPDTWLVSQGGFWALAAQIRLSFLLNSGFIRPGNLGIMFKFGSPSEDLATQSKCPLVSYEKEATFLESLCRYLHSTSHKLLGNLIKFLTSGESLRIRLLKKCFIFKSRSYEVKG